MKFNKANTPSALVTQEMEHCSHSGSSSMLPVPVVAPLCHSGRNRHLAFSPWSGTPVRSPLVFCKHFRV